MRHRRVSSEAGLTTSPHSFNARAGAPRRTPLGIDCHANDAANASVNGMRRAIAGLGGGLAVLWLSACSLQPSEVPQLSDAVLCDIVVHRDTSRGVRAAAQDELDVRKADCDHLATVLNRQRMDGLRRQLRPTDPETNPQTYTDCVLNPICRETR